MLRPLSFAVHLAAFLVLSLSSARADGFGFGDVSEAQDSGSLECSSFCLKYSSEWSTFDLYFLDSNSRTNVIFGKQDDEERLISQSAQGGDVPVQSNGVYFETAVRVGPPSATPEPGTLALCGMALSAAALWSRRRRRQGQDAASALP